MPEPESPDLTNDIDFEVLAATLRSRGISFAAPMQNLGQGKALYDQTGWQTIMDTTLFLGSSDAEPHKWVAEALGKQAFRTVDYSTNRGRTRTGTIPT